MSRFSIRLRKHLWTILFISPMFILFLVFTIYPLLASIRYTFYDWNGIGDPTRFVGFKHYEKIAQDPFFWNAFKNTFIYAGTVVTAQLFIAMPLAVLLNSRKLRLRGLFRTIYFLPIVTSSAVVGIVITLFIISAGDTISLLFQSFGWIDRPIDWLGNPYAAFWIVIVVGIWIGLGYPIIYFLAGLQSLAEDLYDAAKIDGAGTVELFRHITLPLMRPVILVVLLILSVYSLRVFDIVQVMTKGGPYFATDVVGTYIYRYAFPKSGIAESEANLGFASAAAFFMGMLVMIISMTQIAIARRVTTWRYARDGKT